MKNQILDSYKENKPQYIDFKDNLVSLIKILAEKKGISTQTICGRIKTFNSLERKIDTKDKYSCIDEITDIVGIRIITYLSNEVDAVKNLIEKEFVVDYDNSIDKRVMEDDRFGYQSLHLICTLSEQRQELPEYEPYKDIKFEIQIRTVLQHAWAEIEHDIGYKSADDIPSHLRRKFFRLASLLELADEEFINITDEIKENKEQILERFAQNDKRVEINRDTLLKYMTTSKDIRYITDEIANRTGWEAVENNELPDGYVSQLNYFGYTTIAGLETDIIEKREIIVDFVVELTRSLSSRLGKIRNIIALHYLFFLRALEQSEKGDNEFFDVFLKDEMIEQNLKRVYQVLKQKALMAHQARIEN